MAHVTAVHHIATATNDVDRFVGFYRDAFDLEPIPGFPMDSPVGRIAFYDLGGVQIQIVESGTIAPEPAEAPAILLQQNLRVDHFTLTIASAEAFAAARDNLIRLGASTGEVQDFRGADLLAYTDPDGHIMEVIHTPADAAAS
jgi:catechol 2,3-dioxygenase-like lactoylglutathione lyase family enzyme